MKSKIELESMFDNAQTMHLQEFINYYTPDTLLKNIVAISKARAYDVIAPQVQELKDQVANLERRNKQLFDALEDFVIFDLSDMEFTDEEDTDKLRAIYLKAKAAIEANNIK